MAKLVIHAELVSLLDGRCQCLPIFHSAWSATHIPPALRCLSLVSCPYVLRQLDPKSWLGVQIGVLVPRDSDPNTEARDPSRTSGIFRPSGGG